MASNAYQNVFGILAGILVILTPIMLMWLWRNSLMRDRRTPQQFGDYRVLNVLNRGGEAVVYKGKHNRTGELVAIRVLSMHENAQAVRRHFLEELKKLQELRHEHIIPLKAFGMTQEGYAFLVMPFVPNGSLVDRVRKGQQFTFEEVLEYLKQAAMALSFAHAYKITHRDVKPHNLLLGENGILLSDFGIALDEEATSTIPRGTPLFCPREQAAGHPVPASDQYALAVTACWLLTGKYPRNGGLADLQVRYPQIALVLARALKDDPKDRYLSMVLFYSALEHASFSGGAPRPPFPMRFPPQPPVEPPPRPPLHPNPPRPRLLIVAVLGVLVLLLLLASLSTWSFLQSRSDPTTRNPQRPSPSWIFPSPGPFSCVAGHIRVGGSTAFQPLLELWATDYTKRCPSASIDVSGGGSSAGVQGASDGTFAIGASDTLSSSSANQEGLVDYRVAAVIFVVIVNGTGATNLPSTSIQKIYTGQVKDWHDVIGGQNLPILPISREGGSGSRGAFERFVLRGPETVTDLPPVATSEDMIGEVQQKAGAIGYASLYDVLRTNSAKLIVSIDDNLASAGSVENGSYLFWSVEHLYVKGKAQGLTKAFIDFMVSDAGKQEMETHSFLPLDKIPPKLRDEHSTV